ncbi:PadR family transcriptional regulator [Enterococcus sp. N249-2]
MYDLLLLGSLVGGDKTGYKLQKIVGSALQPMRKVSSGVLYPSLEKLEKEGLVMSKNLQDVRNTKLWHITPAGTSRFAELMRADIPSDAKRNDMIHFKLRSLNSVSVSVQLKILTDFQAFIESDLLFYQQAQLDMQDHRETYPEQAARFDVIVSSYDLDIQLAQTKLSWIKQQIEQRKATCKKATE